MTYTEIIEKLIGKIQPTGDSNRDLERLDNLKQMCELVNNLIVEIDRVYCDNKESKEHSVKIMAEYANNFLNNTLGITN
jgi:hypothetical protein